MSHELAASTAIEIAMIPNWDLIWGMLPGAAQALNRTHWVGASISSGTASSPRSDAGCPSSTKAGAAASRNSTSSNRPVASWRTWPRSWAFFGPSTTVRWNEAPAGNSTSRRSPSSFAEDRSRREGALANGSNNLGRPQVGDLLDRERCRRVLDYLRLQIALQVARRVTPLASPVLSRSPCRSPPMCPALDRLQPRLRPPGDPRLRCLRRTRSVAGHAAAQDARSQTRRPARTVLRARRRAFAGADFKRKATKWRCPTGECQPRSVWRKASRLHPLIPRETNRWHDLYRGRASIEREFGRLKHEYSLTPIRVRGLERRRPRDARPALPSSRESQGSYARGVEPPARTA